MGSVATIDYNEPDAKFPDSENPPKEEAYWNGRLIGKAPELLALLIKYRENTDLFSEEADKLLKVVLGE